MVDRACRPRARGRRAGAGRQGSARAVRGREPDGGSVPAGRRSARPPGARAAARSRVRLPAVSPQPVRCASAPRAAAPPARRCRPGRRRPLPPGRPRRPAPSRPESRHAGVRTRRRRRRSVPAGLPACPPQRGPPGRSSSRARRNPPEPARPHARTPAAFGRAPRGPGVDGRGAGVLVAAVRDPDRGTRVMGDVPGRLRVRPTPGLPAGRRPRGKAAGRTTPPATGPDDAPQGAARLVPASVRIQPQRRRARRRERPLGVRDVAGTRLACRSHPPEPRVPLGLGPQQTLGAV